MPANPLSMTERIQIRVGIEQQETITAIAARVGRHRSTITEEIKRNGGARRYDPERAQRRAHRQRRRPKTPRLLADPALAEDVQQRLNAKDSPMRISIELAQQGIRISHETIYQSIYNTRGLTKGTHRHLHLQRRRRRPRNHNTAAGSNSLGVYCSIHDRPQSAADRSEFGHLEGDLIVGAYNKSALITIFDRASRFLWLEQPASKSAPAVQAALEHLLLHRIPNALTLTWDQGAEIARHREIALTCGIEIYIADPKSPWQRPTNENGNAIIRRYAPKGTDLNALARADLDHIEQRINTIPRRTHNWATAQDIYHQLTR